MVGCKMMRTLASVEFESILILKLPCCLSSSSVRCLKNVGTRCRNSTPEIAGRSKDGSGPVSVASVLEYIREKRHFQVLHVRTGKEAFQMLVWRHQGIQRYEIDRPSPSRVMVLRCSIQKRHVIQRYESDRPAPSRVTVLRCSIQKRHLIQRYEIDRPTPSRDWSDQAEEGPNYAIMAYFTSSSNSEKSDDEDESVSQPKIEMKIVKPSVAKVEFVKPKQQSQNARKTVKNVEKSRQTVTTNTARPVNTDHPKTTMNAAKPMSYFSNSAHSIVKRPIQSKIAFKNSLINQRVNTVRNKHVNTTKPKTVVNTARLKAVLNAVKGNEVYALKASACWVWKPKIKILDHVSKHNSASITLMKYDYIDAQGRSKVPRKNNMYSVDLKNIIPKIGTKDNNNVAQARKEKEPGKDYILLPLWIAYPPFPQEPKSSQDAEFKPSNDVGKKVNEVPRQENECKDQEEKDNVNNTNRVNAVSSTVNVASNEVNDVGRKSSIELPNDLNMPELEDISLSEDSNEDVFGAKANLNNLESTFQIEAIRLFLAYASFKDFVVYQMDVKSAFLYEKIEEEVYVCQPPGFEDPDFPDKVYKVENALYGLHQAPRAWYETLSTYFLDNGFHRGKIDKTLFIKRHKDDILLVQVYVNDTIFGSTKKELCNAFEKMTHEKFQMSSMGELTFFLRLHVKQKLISWQCKKQTVVTNSTTEAEYVAASSCCGQFWTTAKSKIVNGEVQIHALVDGMKYLSPKTSAWNEFSSTIAFAIICLATNRTFNFSKMIFDGMLRNLDNVSGKFLMYLRFIQTCLDKQLDELLTHKEKYDVSFHTKKVFANMKRIGNGFSGKETPLFPTMTQKPRQPKRNTTKVPQPSESADIAADEAVHKEGGYSLVRATTTASSLEVE
nr:putative ribonuclease H-like domain-containing protein [Tanacetum cinerariifolium]